jgi:methionyl-tRNA formyltransferase
MKMQPTRISAWSTEAGITCLKPASLKEPEFQEILENYKADFFLIADYGAIVPKNILEIEGVLTLCVHPSLLPLYRGASPIESALLNGDSLTGVTIFKVNEKVDAGDILAQKTVAIDSNDDRGSLLKKLACAGVPLLFEALSAVEKGTAGFSPQDEKKATLTKKISKAEAKIDWKEPAVDVHNKIRAFRGWPAAHTFYNDRLIQIFTAEVVSGSGRAKPGAVAKIDKEGIYVACGKDFLKIKSLKPQGKKEMSARAFLCGYDLKEGDLFC